MNSTLTEWDTSNTPQPPMRFCLLCVSVGTYLCIYSVSVCLCVQPRVLQTLCCGHPAVRLQLQHGQQEVTELSRLIQRPLILLQQNLEKTPRLQTGDVTQLAWDRYREVRQVVRNMGTLRVYHQNKNWTCVWVKYLLIGPSPSYKKPMDRNSKGEKSATTPKVHFTYNRPITELHMTFSLQSVSPLLLKYSLEYLPDSAKGRGIGPSSSMMWAMWSINTQGVKTHTAVLFISLHAEFHYYSVVFLYCSSVCSRGARFLGSIRFKKRFSIQFMIPDCCFELLFSIWLR